MEHVIDQDYKDLLDNYKQVENEIIEYVNKIKPTIRSRILVFPFDGGRAFYSRDEDRVIKIKAAKITNPECLEFRNVDIEPIYEYFEIEL